VVGVHVQVHVDESPPIQARAHARIPFRRVTPCGELRVQLLQLVRRPSPVEAGEEGAGGADEPLPQAAVRHQPLELRGERDDVAGLEQQPALAVPQNLFVDRQPGGERHGPGREAAQQQPRVGSGPGGRSYDDVSAR
jgi:hypothetical protein